MCCRFVVVVWLGVCCWFVGVWLGCWKGVVRYCFSVVGVVCCWFVVVFVVWCGFVVIWC